VADPARTAPTPPHGRLRRGGALVGLAHRGIAVAIVIILLVVVFDVVVVRFG
jgi:hypothetical protein